MEFTEIGLGDLPMLEDFLSRLSIGKQSFRYFDKRPLSIIEQHVSTLLLMEDDRAIAYGHLDQENDTVWLGIAVADDERGKGYGKWMMQALLQKARELEISAITLTVDQENVIAQRLYERMGFEEVGQAAHYRKYQLIL
ncbi:MAG: GNAT family N-acetyltransferase [Bacteroidota bacterium]